MNTPNTRAAMLVFAISAATVLLASCGKAEEAKPAIAGSPIDSSELLREIAVAESTAAVLDEWNKAEVVKRLSEAGLVVSDRKEEVRQPFLSVPGDLLEVSESQLQIFIYPSIASREADSRKLEPAGAAPRDVVVSWIQPPHLTVSGKLLAIHLTHNEHLAERVSDVLSARHTGASP